MKGVSPVVIVLFVVIIILLIEGYILNTYLVKYFNIKVVSREIDIIKNANLMYNIERSIPYGLYYSYLRALEEGNFSAFNEIPKENVTEFEKNLTLIFYNYTEKLYNISNIRIPKGVVKVENVSSNVIVSFESNEKIEYKSGTSEYMLIVYGNPNSSISFIEENGRRDLSQFLYDFNLLLSRV